MDNSNNTANSKSKPNVGLIVGISLIVVLLAVGIWFLINSLSKTTTTTTSTSKAPTQPAVLTTAAVLTTKSPTTAAPNTTNTIITTAAPTTIITTTPVPTTPAATTPAPNNNVKITPVFCIGIGELLPYTNVFYYRVYLSTNTKAFSKWFITQGGQIVDSDYTKYDSINNRLIFTCLSTPATDASGKADGQYVVGKPIVLTTNYHEFIYDEQRKIVATKWNGDTTKTDFAISFASNGNLAIDYIAQSPSWFMAPAETSGKTGPIILDFRLIVDSLNLDSRILFANSNNSDINNAWNIVYTSQTTFKIVCKSGASILAIGISGNAAINAALVLKNVADAANWIIADNKYLYANKGAPYTLGIGVDLKDYDTNTRKTAVKLVSLTSEFCTDIKITSY